MRLNGLTIASLFIAMALCLSGTASYAQSVLVPNLTGRVVDLANMIDADDEAKLVVQLEAHENSTTNQIVVLTIPSLQGAALEEYSLNVARTWALGQKGKDNGVLFLIARDDRKLRIEVGYGLEGILTDAISSFILRQTVTRLFRQGMFSGGILAGTGQIIDVLESDDAALKEWQDRSQPKDNSSEPEWPMFVFIGLWLMIFFGGFLSSILVRMFGTEIKPGHYRWLGIDAGPNAPKPKRSGRRSSGGWMGGGSSSGGGFGGGGGGFGGGGSSGGW